MRRTVTDKTMQVDCVVCRRPAAPAHFTPSAKPIYPAVCNDCLMAVAADRGILHFPGWHKMTDETVAVLVRLALDGDR